MHSLNNRGVHTENLRIFPNCAPSKMDYRQKMVVPSSQKVKHEDDEDEDLEALRLAALKSLRAKNTLQSAQQPALLPQPARPRTAAYPPCPTVYGQQRTAKRGFYQNRPPRQNGTFYYQQSRVNQNLIEIVPVEEDEGLQKNSPRNDLRTVKTETGEHRDPEGDSKFCRYTDNASGSEEEDTKESNSVSTTAPTSRSERLEGEESGTEKDVQSGFEESPRGESAVELEGGQEEGEEEEEEEVEEEDDGEEEDEEEEEEEEEEEDEEEEKPANDDDDDILLMADLEEEDSLERLMDEMEREMNSDKPVEKKEKKPLRRETKDAGKPSEVQKPRNSRKSRSDRAPEKNGISSAKPSLSSQSSSSIHSSVPPKTSSEARPLSPRPAPRTQQQQQQKRRSQSPKPPRSRKKSPRRSPPPPPPPPRQQGKKLSREIPRTRSPRRPSPPSRFSPSRSPIRRSPGRKLSPRGRSPRSRSPRARRSRSPRPISRSRSPPRPLRSPKRLNRSRSPRIVRSRSPRASPVRLSPLRARSPLRTRSPLRRSPIRGKSPTLRGKSPPLRGKSPHRLSPPRRPSPRTRSPRSSPRRAISPRGRSPKISPERRRASPVRIRSPGGRASPRRSPWNSPRNSPRLSPRRRRSPAQPARKPRQRSISPPEEKSNAGYKRESSPPRKSGSTVAATSPEATKSKTKLAQTSAVSKETAEPTNDPVLEARRRKFESNKLIDPVNDNKKIKLSRKETTSRKVEAPVESQPPESPEERKSCEIIEENYDQDSDLCLTDDYVYEVLEDVVSDASSTADNSVAMCVEMVPVKPEKTRSKKKKKRDKEIYQVGKQLKVELPLSERIGKEKKCKKRKDRSGGGAASNVESSPEHPGTVEDLTVDEEGDLRTELSRRRAERLSRAAPIQSARLLQSAFKGVVKEVAKTNAKVNQRHATKGDEKSNKKEVRRVTVLHRQVADLPDSEDEEAVVDAKVPVRFRLGLNKPATQDGSREPKAARKSSKRQGRKVKHKNSMSLGDHERKKQ